MKSVFLQMALMIWRDVTKNVFSMQFEILGLDIFYFRLPFWAKNLFGQFRVLIGWSEINWSLSSSN